MSSSNGSVNGLLHEGDRVASGYEVIAHLSRGTALDVYDAWSLERDCRCVVKVVRPDRRAPRVRRRLIQEGELLLKLVHPNIVRAYELRRRPRTVVILETLGGETVEHMVHSAPGAWRSWTSPTSACRSARRSAICTDVATCTST